VAERIVVHAGTMKSGTTYLQNVLRGFDAQLRDAGWLYPATWDRAHEVPSHERALGGLVGSAIPWLTADAQAARRPAWERLQAAAGDWPGPVLLSAEALAVMDEGGIAALLGSLPATRFRIVITARDLGRVIPSSWQQHVRNGRTDSYAAYLAMIRDARGGGGQPSGPGTFWRSYRLPDVVRRWRAGPGVDEVVIATVPHEAPTAELWRRFREASDLPATIPAEPPEVPRVLAHVGATASEALIVEAIVRQLEHEGVPLAVRSARARMVLVGALLPRKRRGSPLRLPAAWVEEVAGWASADVEELYASGVPIVGSLDDLLVVDRGADGPIAPPEEVAEAAAVALLNPVRGGSERGDRERNAERSVPRGLLSRLVRRTRRVVRRR
jgi:hypothetical protein